MPTLASPIASIVTYHALTSMQTNTLTTWLFITLGISSFPWLNLGLSWILNEILPMLELASSEGLGFLPSRPLFLRRIYSTSCECTINLPSYILSCNMAAQNSSSRSSDTSATNLLISSLLLDTREEAYLESLTNLKEYSLAYIPPWSRLMKSSTLTSL